MNTEYSNPAAQTPPAAFCQNCGRPLTADEVRSVAGHVYCDPCLAAKVGAQPASPSYQAVPPVYPAAPYMGPNPGGHSPLLAGLLGLIPGVGAMYNGQFIKGIIHVLIFIGLIAATDHFSLLGIAIGIWYIYMIFDAVQTAQAIRMGMPVPDPLGLNQISIRLGAQLGNQTAATGAVPPAAPYAAQPPAAAYPAPVPPAGAEVPGPIATAISPYAPPVAPPYSAAPPVPPLPPVPPERSLPVGAIILIVLGGLFALGTINGDLERVISRGWPVLLIALGVWLFFRNTRKGGVQ